MKRIAKKILATSAMIVCLPLFPIAGCAQGNPVNTLMNASMNTSNAFHETLTVTQQRRRVLVTMVFHNASDRKVFVPNAVAIENSLSNALFEIADERGEIIPYIGIMAKRAAPTIDDYHTVPPHATHRNTIDITDSYAFKRGNHRYALSYHRHYLTDPAKVNHGSPLGVLRAEFKFNYQGR